MGKSYRVDVTYSRVVTFYVEAGSKADVEGYLDSHPDWAPADREGLIDLVSDEVEEGYEVLVEKKIQPNFRITPELDLEEIER